MGKLKLKNIFFHITPQGDSYDCKHRIKDLILYLIYNRLIFNESLIKGI